MNTETPDIETLKLNQAGLELQLADLRRMMGEQPEANQKFIGSLVETLRPFVTGERAPDVLMAIALVGAEATLVMVRETLAILEKGEAP